MSYEIPQQLEYNEKILFGLTFKQLGYASAGALLDFLILKKPWSTIAKLSLALPIAAVTSGFMFFNWSEFIKNYWSWRKKRTIILDEENIKHYLDVREIGKDYAVVNKRKVAIVKVTPINFSIRAEDERETVIRSFQKFLNSLDFPIQFMMTTEGVDLQDYLTNLAKRASKTSALTGNDLFLQHYSALKKFLLSTIKDQKIRNRSFYVVIPESSGLDVQVKIVEERLNNASLLTKRLDGEDIKRLMLRFFNASGKDMPLLQNHPDFLDNDGMLSRVVSAFGYPRSVEAGFLDKIVTAEGDFDLSIHVKPYPIDRMMVNLNRELQKQRADLYSAEMKGAINPTLEIQYADTRKVLDELQKGVDKLFNVSLYIHCKAEDKESLELLSKKVESELNSILIIPKIPKYKMLQGLKSVAPFATDALNIQRNITTRAASAFFPFTSKFLEIDNSGVWFGLNKTKIPIIKDVFRFSNPNGTILASSGAGKSYLAKLFIARQLLNGVKVIVIDPQGEYTDLVKAYGGQVIELSRDSDSIINPLDLIDHDYTEKRLSLMDMTKVMFGDLSEVQKGFLDKAIGITYDDKGIVENDPDSLKKDPPILKDLLKSLKKLEENASELEKTSIRSLINRLDIYVTGVFKFLNQHTKIDFNNRFVCFNINKLPNQVKPLMMFLVLDYVYTKMKKDIERKMLVIDESWALLSRTEDAGYIFEIVKTCRKFNLALLLINQEVEGLLASQAGKSVLANSSYTFLLKQKPAVIAQLKKTFDLSETEKNHLLGASVGEGLLITEQDHSEIKIVASEQEHDLITTNADERLKRRGLEKMQTENVQEVIPDLRLESKPEPKTDVKKKEEVVEVKLDTKPEPKAESESKEELLEIKQDTKPEPKLDLAPYPQQAQEEIKATPELAPEQPEFDISKPFHEAKELTKKQAKLLLDKGFKLFEAYSHTFKKIRKCYIKTRKNEKPEHVFYIYDTADNLKKLGSNVQIYLEADKPDITYEYQGVEFAVEVETGEGYLYNKDKLLRRVNALNKNYGNNWYFFLTNQSFSKKYAKLGNLMMPKT